MANSETYRAFLRDHQLVLAPMAGVTDVVMRQLCIEQGASLTFTEMVSAKGLSYNNERTGDLLEVAPNEHKVGVQLFGHEPKTMAEQAQKVHNLLRERLAVIDINMGCPARKIVTKGDGASLMERPKEARAIIAAVVGEVDVPVTVKFRRGYAQGAEVAPAFAQMAQEAGAAAVTVHGRYAAQMYHGQADWGTIARVVNAVDIPVIGNGDITCGADAVHMMNQTGCTAVMVARGAQGNPWLFAQIRAALHGSAAPEAPSGADRIAIMRRHAHLLFEWEPRSLVRMRKHASWYCKGMPEASVARAAFNACNTLNDFELVFNQLEHIWAGV